MTYELERPIVTISTPHHVIYRRDKNSLRTCRLFCAVVLGISIIEYMRMTYFLVSVALPFRSSWGGGVLSSSSSLSLSLVLPLSIDSHATTQAIATKQGAAAYYRGLPSNLRRPTESFAEAFRPTCFQPSPPTTNQPSTINHVREGLGIGKYFGVSNYSYHSLYVRIHIRCWSAICLIKRIICWSTTTGISVAWLVFSSILVWFYGSPPNFSLTKSPVLKPAPGRIS